MTHEELPPPELRELLDAERVIPPLPSEVSARLAGRLDRTLGLPPLLPPSGAPAASGAEGARAAGWLAHRMPQLALAFLAGGVVGGLIAVSALAPRRDADPSQVHARPPSAQPLPARDEVEGPPAPVREPASPGFPPPAPEPQAEPTTPLALAAQPRRPAAADGAPSGGDLGDRDLAAERHLLEVAHEALGRGRAQDALSALERHARRFPQGRLAEERESLRVPSLVVLGRHDEARAAADRFLARYPTSLFAPVVRSSLQSIP